MHIEDREYDSALGLSGTWTFGTGGVDGRYGGVHTYPLTGKATARLSWWARDPLTGMHIVHRERTVRCRNARAGVRVLRRWLRGHNQ